MLPRMVLFAGALFAWLCHGPAAMAQAYPDRPVRIVSAFSVGAGPDAMLRVVAEKLAAKWKQPVIVENRPGGNGFIAIENVKNAAPDGLTLLHVDGLNFTAMRSLYAKLPYSEKDFQPISPIHRSYFFIAVSSASPWTSMNDLVNAAKAKPGSLTYGSWQVGSVAHLGGATLEALTSTQMRHIPFKDMQQLYTAVANREVDWALGSMASAGPLYRSGKLRFIAVAGPGREAILPDVPTATETGAAPGFEASAWVGLFAPAGVPAATVQTISADLRQAMADERIRQKMIEFGYMPTPMSPAENRDLIEKEAVAFRETIKRSGITVE